MTRSPADAVDLSRMLRAQGYEVEIVDPGSFAVDPADLELTVEVRAPEEALARALELTEEGEIYVAAGALPASSTRPAKPRERRTSLPEAGKRVERSAWMSAAVGQLRAVADPAGDAVAEAYRTLAGNAHRARALLGRATENAQAALAQAVVEYSVWRSRRLEAAQEARLRRQQLEAVRARRREEERAAAQVEQWGRESERRQQAEAAARRGELERQLRELSRREEEERRRARPVVGQRVEGNGDRQGQRGRRPAPAAAIPRRRGRERENRFALAVAAALALAVLGGIVGLTGRPAAEPAPATATAEVAAEPVEAPAVAPAAAVAPPEPAAEVSRRESHAERRPRPSALPDSDVEEPVVIYHERPKARSARGEAEVAYADDEVVVRHYRGQARQKPGSSVKRITDQE